MPSIAPKKVPLNYDHIFYRIDRTPLGDFKPRFLQPDEFIPAEYIVLMDYTQGNKHAFVYQYTATMIQPVMAALKDKALFDLYLQDRVRSKL